MIAIIVSNFILGFKVNRDIKYLNMKRLIIFNALMLLGSVLLAQPTKNLNLNKKKVAVMGYDVVSYFDGQPAIGSNSLAVDYNGAKYYFISNEHKHLFESNPNKYIPQYGGWCAYAMGIDGSKVKIDPMTFKIVDDKLYLFYNFKKLNTLTLWNENEAQFKAVADDQWSLKVSSN